LRGSQLQDAQNQCRSERENAYAAESRWQPANSALVSRENRAPACESGERADDIPNPRDLLWSARSLGHLGRLSRCLTQAGAHDDE
jgi:hypothetical protein